MEKTLKAYLARASEIIGDRTSGEIAYDDAVVEALNQGRTIKEAIAIASGKHPDDALQWDEDNISDIAAHYEYLRQHMRIMRTIRTR